MLNWLMRGHFGHLHFKTFPMTRRTLKCEEIWPLQLSSEFLGVPEDSNFPLLGVWASPSHLAQSGVATMVMIILHYLCKVMFGWICFNCIHIWTLMDNVILSSEHIRFTTWCWVGWYLDHLWWWIEFEAIDCLCFKHRKVSTINLHNIMLLLPHGLCGLELITFMLYINVMALAFWIPITNIFECGIHIGGKMKISINETLIVIRWKGL
jgi:hypothetical protein